MAERIVRIQTNAVFASQRPSSWPRGLPCSRPFPSFSLASMRTWARVGIRELRVHMERALQVVAADEIRLYRRVQICLRLEIQCRMRGTLDAGAEQGAPAARSQLHLSNHSRSDGVLQFEYIPDVADRRSATTRARRSAC